MRGGTADEHLGREEKGNNDKVLDGRLLTFRNDSWQHGRVNMVAVPLPSEIIEPSKKEQNESCCRE